MTGLLVFALCWLGNGLVLMPQSIQINISSPVLLAVPIGIAIAIVVTLLLMSRERKPEPQPKPEKPSTPIDRARQVATDARNARQRIPD